ncbi:nucleoside phosphorylase [Cryomorphaceae bacterium 1068]|nr:nucleoside phosphorylase [Cryomorphaceae bacterium 1068]
MKKFPLNNSLKFAPSELPVNGDGSIYHLAIKPEHLADTVLVVGDQGRVEKISKHFDRTDVVISNREFVTHTGYIGSKRITALSTGIGTDNIDIVLNELDALRSIDFEKRETIENPKPLEIIRIGTSGGLRKEIEPGSFIHSRFAIGLDAVMHYYQAHFEEDEIELARSFAAHVNWSLDGIKPYAVKSSAEAGSKFQEGFIQGLTATACGFYGPQGRKIRLPVAMPDINERMGSFSFGELPLANYEMESSALFGLGAALGHQCTTVCLVVANRAANSFLTDHHVAMEELIATVLERVSAH